MSISKMRAPRVNDDTLDPVYGNLQCRLQANPMHWPREPRGRPKCALHRWAANIDQKPHVMFCSACEIHLCRLCFEKFHTIHDLVKEKKNIATYMLVEKEKDEKKRPKEQRTVQ
jgi:B-box zinc finger